MPIGLGLHLVAGVIGALIAYRFRVPGGLVIGAVIGSAIVGVATTSAPEEMPMLLRNAALVVIGTFVGMSATREAVVSLRDLLLPSFLAASVLILCAFGIALALRALGVVPEQGILATSPGAFSMLLGIAVQDGRGVLEVTLFHLTRIVLVATSFPLLLYLYERR